MDTKYSNLHPTNGSYDDKYDQRYRDISRDYYLLIEQERANKLAEERLAFDRQKEIEAKKAQDKLLDAKNQEIEASILQAQRYKELQDSLQESQNQLKLQHAISYGQRIKLPALLIQKFLSKEFLDIKFNKLKNKLIDEQTDKIYKLQFIDHDIKLGEKAKKGIDEYNKEYNDVVNELKNLQDMIDDPSLLEKINLLFNRLKITERIDDLNMIKTKYDEFMEYYTKNKLEEKVKNLDKNKSNKKQYEIVINYNQDTLLDIENKLDEKLEERKKQFKQFRENHYNEDAEYLINLIENEPSYIYPIKQGDVEDYKTYIENELKKVE